LIPSAQDPDLTPRLYGSADAIVEKHGYSWGVEYAALHFALTGKPVIVVGMPIDVPGVVSREDVTGNSGGSSTSVTAGGDGVLAEHDGQVIVEKGGTVGTDPIVLRYSLDGGRTTKRYRLGTATTFVVPNVNVTVGFTVGTLVAGETVHTWHGSAPRMSTSDLAAVRAAFAARLQGFRAILPIGDLQDSSQVGALRDMVRAYDTDNDRFVYARCSVRDRSPEAALSSVERPATGSPVVTFDDDVGGDTITRATGSFLADGFAIGDSVVIDGSASNDGEHFPTAVSELELAVAGPLVDEATVSGVSILARTGLTFAATGETVTRSRGSWIADGFREGESVTIDGTDSGTNDGTFVVSTLTDLVMTLAAGAVDADEKIAAEDVTFTQGQTMADWGESTIAAFGSVSSSPEVDIMAGRARRNLPYSGWFSRIPAAWECTIREFSQPVQQVPWRKDVGALGCELTDEDGNVVEWDDRLQGEAFTQAGISALRSWSNGPLGTFVSMALTRADEGSLLQLTTNKAVVDIGRTVVQLATENVVGRFLEKKTDGSGEATEDSLSEIESYVNNELEKGVLVPRLMSGAVWAANRDDRFDTPESFLHGVATFTVHGVVHTVDTKIKVQ
jgi:hypothetical protein